MGLKVFWTDTAKHQLLDIYYYYKEIAGKKVATKISKGINTRTKLLKDQPNIGPLEHSLKNRKNKYRYLVEGNYKIIYWVDNNLIKIASVFDCRQNPEKMSQELT